MTEPSAVDAAGTLLNKLDADHITEVRAASWAQALALIHEHMSRFAEQRVAAAVQEERKRCVQLALEYRGKAFAAILIAKRIRGLADRPAPEDAAPTKDGDTTRCSTTSREDTGPVSGEADLRHRPGSASNTEASQGIPTDYAAALAFPIAAPGPTAGDVERARELLLGWMNTRPAGVYLSSIQSREFQRLIELIADAFEAAREELLAQIREILQEAEAHYVIARKFPGYIGVSESANSLVIKVRALVDKLTEGTP